MSIVVSHTLLARAAVLLLLVATAAAAYPQTIASDFELQQMRKQAASATTFLARIQAHLNLGDLHRTRTEREPASRQYLTSLDLAERERTEARQRRQVRRYVIATAYAGLACAKLEQPAKAFTLLEEAMRYGDDTARAWNIYAISMNELGHSRKAAAAARNALAVASAEAKKTPTIAELLDLNVYRYTLAGALIDDGQETEARGHLETIVQTLRSPRFDAVRRTVAKQEAFEIYFVTAGDPATYVSLLNRAQLRLGDLYERAGENARALAVYEAVLADRSDDPDALAARVRLGAQSDRDARYAEAFDANPFSLPLVREYQDSLTVNTPAEVEPSTPGARVRDALIRIARGETRAARAQLQALLQQHPRNETLLTLLAETDAVPDAVSLPGDNPTAAELSALIPLFDQNRLTAEQRVALDQATYTSTIIFDAAIPAPEGQTAFATGNIAGVRVRFGEPTAFTGTFPVGKPLRLTYRILGATETGGAGALLLEPLKLVKP